MNLKSAYISVHRYMFYGLSYEEALELGETMDYILDEDRAKKFVLAILSELPGNMADHFVDPILSWVCGCELTLTWNYSLEAWLPYDDFCIEHQLLAICFYSYFIQENNFIPFGEYESRKLQRFTREIKKTIKRLIQDA
jgi:hypothetical protein